jgi:hypothetical protein
MFLLNRYTLMSLISVLLIAGCQSEPVKQEVLINTLPNQLYSYYKNTNLQLQHPKGFVVKTKSQIANQYSNDVELLFESSKTSPLMKSVILVETFNVPQNSEHQLLSAAFFEDNKSKLINFIELPSEIFNTVVSGQYFQAEVKHFKGRRNLSGSDLEFYQTYLLRDNKLYIATAAFDPQDPYSEADNLRESLKTLTIF